MTDSIDFERRVKRSIQESIAVKNLLLEDADIVSTIAEVSAGLVDSLDKGTRCSFLEMVEALPTPRDAGSGMEEWRAGCDGRR